MRTEPALITVVPLTKRLGWLLGGMLRGYFLTVLVLGTVAACWKFYYDEGSFNNAIDSFLEGVVFGGFYLGFLFVVALVPLILWILLIPATWLDWEIQAIVALGVGGILPAFLAAAHNHPSNPQRFGIFLFSATATAAILGLILLHVSSRANAFAQKVSRQTAHSSSSDQAAHSAAR